MRAFAALVVAAGVALSPPASATTLARLTVEQMADASEYVVRGTVAEVWTGLDDAGRVWTHAEIDVAEVLKGAPGDTLVVESPGGRYDGVYAEVESAARYAVGEDVFLFVSRKGDSDRFGTVAMYAGKYTVRVNPADGTEMVVHYTVPYSRTWDPRFIPNPPADQRVSLASLEERVRARVALGWDGQPIPGISSDRLRAINRLQEGVK